MVNSNISIKNMRYDGKPIRPWQVKVDRSSPLGNPFVMEEDTEEERQWVCNEYENWFNSGFSNGISRVSEDRYYKICEELIRLKEVYKQYGKLELFCWCSPKRCHAETIKKYLEEVHNEKK